MLKITPRTHTRRVCRDRSDAYRIAAEAIREIAGNGHAEEFGKEARTIANELQARSNEYKEKAEQAGRPECLTG